MTLEESTDIAARYYREMQVPSVENHASSNYNTVRLRINRLHLVQSTIRLCFAQATIYEKVDSAWCMQDWLSSCQNTVDELIANP